MGRLIMSNLGSALFCFSILIFVLNSYLEQRFWTYSKPEESTSETQGWKDWVKIYTEHVMTSIQSSDLKWL